MSNLRNEPQALGLNPNLAGFTRTDLLNLLIQNEIRLNSDGDTGLYYMKEDKTSGNFVIGRRTGNTDNDLVTITPAGLVTIIDLNVTGSLFAGGIITSGIQDVDNTTSITTSSPAETLVFTTNSNERMRIDSSGNIGIGNNNPNELLQINGATRFGNNLQGDLTINPITTFGTTLSINCDSSGNYIATDTATRFDMNKSAFRFLTASSGTAGNPVSFTERMSILGSNGDIGVGITPNKRFHINGETQGTPLRIQNNIGTAQNGLELFKSTSDTWSLVQDEGSTTGTLRLFHNQGGGQFWDVLQFAQSGLQSGSVRFQECSIDLNTGKTDIDFAGDTRRGIARTYNEGIGDTFGIEQVSAAQSNTPSAQTRIFSPNGVGLGRYTSSTAFTDWLTINSVGNVGIGTINPASLLHLSSGTSGDCILRLEADTDNNNENDNPYIIFTQDGGIDESAIGQVDEDNALVLATSATGSSHIIFKTNSSATGYTAAIERMRIESGGFVGIGTTNPNHKLHITRDSMTDSNAGFLLEPESDTGHDAVLEIRGARNGSTTNIQASLTLSNYDNDLSGTRRIGKIGAVVTDAVNNRGDMIFYTYGTGTTPIERMRFDSLGNIGINSTIPSAALDVRGQILSIATSTALNVENSTGGAPQPAAAITKGNVSATSQVFIQFYRNSSVLEGDIRTDALGNLAFQNASDERLKENIIDYTNPYNKFKKLNVKEFEWRNPDKKQEIGKLVGFIAQDLQKANMKCVGEYYADYKKVKKIRKKKINKIKMKKVKKIKIIKDEDDNEIEEEYEVEEEEKDENNNTIYEEVEIDEEYEDKEPIEESKYLGISQTELIPFLWAGVKQLIEDKEQLENKVNQLETTLSSVLDRLDKLENKNKNKDKDKDKPNNN